MADPVSLAMLGGGAGLAGGAVQAYGQFKQGQAQGAMYNYQAGVAQANATLARQDAVYATQSGEVEAQQSGMRTRGQIGATRVGFGAGNVAGRSVNRVIGSEIKIGQTNEADIRANAAKRAYGFNVSAAEDVAQAGAMYEAAHTARTSANIGIASTILGTVGSVASKWSQASQSFGSGGLGGGGTQDTDPTYSSYGYNRT